MANALRSSPPPSPAPSEPRAKYLPPLPGMKLRSPKREAGRRLAAERFDETMRRRGTSNLELSEQTTLNERLIRDWRSGKEGWQGGDLYVIDVRLALALLDMIRFDLLSRLNPNDPHR